MDVYRKNTHKKTVNKLKARQKTTNNKLVGQMHCCRDRFSSKHVLTQVCTWRERHSLKNTAVNLEVLGALCRPGTWSGVNSSCQWFKEPTCAWHAAHTVLQVFSQQPGIHRVWINLQVHNFRHGQERRQRSNWLSKWQLKRAWLQKSQDCLLQSQLGQSSQPQTLP